MTDALEPEAWVFSDGTVVRLGGFIEGDGPMAKELRGDLERRAHGRQVYVSTSHEPGGSEPLDVRDPHHVSCWIGGALRFMPVPVQLISQPADVAPRGAAAARIKAINEEHDAWVAANPGAPQRIH
jgi:hypothetical protein